MVWGRGVLGCGVGADFGINGLLVTTFRGVCEEPNGSSL